MEGLSLGPIIAKPMPASVHKREHRGGAGPVRIECPSCVAGHTRSAKRVRRTSPVCARRPSNGPEYRDPLAPRYCERRHVDRRRRIAGREIRPLSPDEAKVLLQASREHPLDAFVTVALGCGLRLGEALGLQWTDVDLDAGKLDVRRAVQRFGGDAAVRRPLLAERKRLRAALKAA